MSIHYIDICDKIQKLSKIAQNFGSFMPFQILLGAGPHKLYPRYHACLPPGRSHGKVL